LRFENGDFSREDRSRPGRAKTTEKWQKRVYGGGTAPGVVSKLRRVPAKMRAADCRGLTTLDDGRAWKLFAIALDPVRYVRPLTE